MAEWISVKDRLPEENGRYLCYIVDGNGYQRMLCFALNLETVDDYDFYHQNYAGFYDYDSEYGYFEYTDVTHWMPLPEPPFASDNNVGSKGVKIPVISMEDVPKLMREGD